MKVPIARALAQSIKTFVEAPSISGLIEAGRWFDEDFAINIAVKKSSSHVKLSSKHVATGSDGEQGANGKWADDWRVILSKIDVLFRSEAFSHESRFVLNWSIVLVAFDGENPTSVEGALFDYVIDIFGDRHWFDDA